MPPWGGHSGQNWVNCAKYQKAFNSPKKLNELIVVVDKKSTYGVVCQQLNKAKTATNNQAKNEYEKKIIKNSKNQSLQSKER